MRTIVLLCPSVRARKPDSQCSTRRSMWRVGRAERADHRQAAEQTALSKSRLFGHFRSKEELQLQVLEHARTRFEEAVARPALRTTRGQPRIRALFEHWIAWDAHPGGSSALAAPACQPCFGTKGSTQRLVPCVRTMQEAPRSVAQT
jgi:AcrR family transcriptional regulator